MSGEPRGEAAKRAFLREVGTGDIAHVRIPLFDHLVGTRDLLASWGAPPALCDAALFHSVYGTEQLDPRLDHPPVARHERDRVRAQIGAEAERIVWLFANLDRKGFVDWAASGARGPLPTRRGVGRVDPTPEEVRALANLVVANALEQVARRHRGERRRTRALIRLAPLLLPDARDDLRRERTWRRRMQHRWRERRRKRRAAHAAPPPGPPG